MTAIADLVPDGIVLRWSAGSPDAVEDHLAGGGTAVDLGPLARAHRAPALVGARLLRAVELDLAAAVEASDHLDRLLTAQSVDRIELGLLGGWDPDLDLGLDAAVDRLGPLLADGRLAHLGTIGLAPWQAAVVAGACERRLGVRPAVVLASAGLLDRAWEATFPLLGRTIGAAVGVTVDALDDPTPAWLDDAAADLGCTPVALAVAWLRRRAELVVLPRTGAAVSLGGDLPASTVGALERHRPVDRRYPEHLYAPAPRP